MNTKVGRNDPCPCGSGKKYKRCHLPLDRQRKPRVEEAQEEAEYIPPAIPAKPSAAFLRELVDKVPKERRAEFNDLLSRTLEVAEYMEHQEEIQAAGAALESHREEFNKLIEDEPAYLNQAQKLFEEDRFEPLRFTADDVRRAFEHVGGPPNFSMREETAKTLHTAIVFLAVKERREQWSMNLLRHLPHYVKAGRFMDAWIIQFCALATSDFVKESNAFLYEMFSYGFEAWSSEKQARDEELLLTLGMDPVRLRSMSMDEINAWLREQQADPAKKERWEAFLEANPERRQMAMAELENLEREYVTLLEREDARALLLSQGEIEPWLPALLDSWQKALENKPALADGDPAEQETKKAFSDVIEPILGEMARNTFAPERITQLVIQLENYQREVFAGGDKRAAACLMTAINSLKKGEEPDENNFLIALCFASLRALLAAVARPSA
jgi:hypothetical protein